MILQYKKNEQTGIYERTNKNNIIEYLFGKTNSQEKELMTSKYVPLDLSNRKDYNKYSDIKYKVQNIRYFMDKQNMTANDAAKYLNINDQEIIKFAEGYLGVRKEIDQIPASFGTVVNSIETTVEKTTVLDGLFKKLGVSIGNIGKMLTSSLLNVGIWMAVSFAVGKIVQAISDAINHEKILIENGKKAKEEIDKINQEYSKKNDVALGQRGKNWASAIDYNNVSLNDNSNINLGKDAYDEFLETSKELVDLFPQLVSGYDAQGNALIDFSDYGNSAAEALKNLLEQERRIADFKISENIMTAFEGTVAEVSKLTSELENVNKEIDTYKNLEFAENAETLDDLGFKNIIETGSKQLKTISNQLDAKVKKEADASFRESIENAIAYSKIDPSKFAIIDNTYTDKNGYIETETTYDFSKLTDKEYELFIESFQNSFDGTEEKVGEMIADSFNISSSKQKEIAASWNSLVPSLQGMLSVYDDYNDLSDEMKAAINTAIGNLDPTKEFTKSNESWIKAKEENPDNPIRAWLRATFLDPLSEDYVDKYNLDIREKNLYNDAISGLFNIDKSKLNSNDFSNTINEYYKTIEHVIGKEKTLDLFVKLGFKVKTENGKILDEQSMKREKLENLFDGFDISDFSAKEIDDLYSRITAKNSKKNKNTYTKYIKEIRDSRNKEEMTSPLFSSIINDDSDDSVKKRLSNISSQIDIFKKSLVSLKTGETIAWSEILGTSEFDIALQKMKLDATAFDPTENIDITNQALQTAIQLQLSKAADTLSTEVKDRNLFGGEVDKAVEWFRQWTNENINFNKIDFNTGFLGDSMISIGENQAEKEYLFDVYNQLSSEFGNDELGRDALYALSLAIDIDPNMAYMSIEELKAWVENEKVDIRLNINEDSINDVQNKLKFMSTDRSNIQSQMDLKKQKNGILSEADYDELLSNDLKQIQLNAKILKIRKQNYNDAKESGASDDKLLELQNAISEAEGQMISSRLQYYSTKESKNNARYEEHQINLEVEKQTTSQYQSELHRKQEHGIKTTESDYNNILSSLENQLVIQSQIVALRKEDSDKNKNNKEYLKAYNDALVEQLNLEEQIYQIEQDKNALSLNNLKSQYNSQKELYDYSMNDFNKNKEQGIITEEDYDRQQNMLNDLIQIQGGAADQAFSIWSGNKTNDNYSVYMNELSILQQLRDELESYKKERDTFNIDKNISSNNIIKDRFKNENDKYRRELTNKENRGDNLSENDYSNIIISDLKVRNNAMKSLRLERKRLEEMNNGYYDDYGKLRNYSEQEISEQENKVAQEQENLNNINLQTQEDIEKSHNAEVNSLKQELSEQEKLTSLEKTKLDYRKEQGELLETSDYNKLIKFSSDELNTQQKIVDEYERRLEAGEKFTKDERDEYIDAQERLSNKQLVYDNTIKESKQEPLNSIQKQINPLKEEYDLSQSELELTKEKRKLNDSDYQNQIDKMNEIINLQEQHVAKAKEIADANPNDTEALSVWMSSQSTLLSFRKEVLDLEKQQLNLPIDNLTENLDTLQSQASNINNIISNKQNKGVKKLDKQYKGLLKNGQLQIKNYREQNKLLEAQMRNLDKESPIYREHQKQLEANKQSIRDMISSQLEYLDALNSANQTQSTMLDNYQKAQQSENASDGYSVIAQGKKGAQELFKQGWGGKDDFTTYAKLIGKNGQTMKEYVLGFEEAVKHVDKYLTLDDSGNITSKGVFNFLNDAVEKSKELGESFVTMNEEGGYTFDFANGNLKQLADQMGVTTEFAALMIQAYNDVDPLADVKLNMNDIGFADQIIEERQKLLNGDIEVKEYESLIRDTFTNLSALQEMGVLDSTGNSFSELGKSIMTLDEALEDDPNREEKLGVVLDMFNELSEQQGTGYFSSIDELKNIINESDKLNEKLISLGGSGFNVFADRSKMSTDQLGTFLTNLKTLQSQFSEDSFEYGYLNKLQSLTEGQQIVQMKIDEVGEKPDEYIAKIDQMTDEQIIQEFGLNSDNAEEQINNIREYAKTQLEDNAMPIKIAESSLNELAEAIAQAIKKGFENGSEDGSEELGKRTKFGNVDLNNREKLIWDKDSIKKYYEDTQIAKQWDGGFEFKPGEISTVLGAYDTFAQSNGITVPIAYTPLLQTGTGKPELLDDSVLHNYITDLIDRNGGKIDENLFALDEKGVGKFKGLIAGIGQEAKKVSEEMHEVEEMKLPNNKVTTSVQQPQEVQQPQTLTQKIQQVVSNPIGAIKDAVMNVRAKVINPEQPAEEVQEASKNPIQMVVDFITGKKNEPQNTKSTNTVETITTGKEGVDELGTSLSQLNNRTITINANSAITATNNVNKLDGAIKRLQGKTVNVIAAGASESARNVEALARSIRSLESKTVNIVTNRINNVSSGRVPPATGTLWSGKASPIISNGYSNGTLKNDFSRAYSNGTSVGLKHDEEAIVNELG